MSPMLTSEVTIFLPGTWLLAMQTKATAQAPTWNHTSLHAHGIQQLHPSVSISNYDSISLLLNSTEWFLGGMNCPTSASV